MKAMSMVRGSVAAALMTLTMSIAGTASARDEASGVTCVPVPGNISAVTCTIASGGGASMFLGAFASDNNGKGGWVEFYSDDNGEWWVEHHADGGTSVGWDAGDFGNNIMGPNLSFGSKEGSYANKSKPKVQGPVTKIPKRTFAAAKAAAAKKTGTLGSMTAPAKTAPGSTSTPVEISLLGSGQCKANIIVQKGGQFVTSTGIVPMSFPSKRTIQLPAAEGDYTVTLQGRDGCLGQAQNTKVSVKKTPRISFAGIGGIAVKP